LAIELGILIFEVHMRSEDEVTQAWGPLSFFLNDFWSGVIFFPNLWCSTSCDHPLAKFGYQQNMKVKTVKDPSI